MNLKTAYKTGAQRETSKGVERKLYVETFHGCLGSPFLQWVNDPLFEDTPIIEGFNPEEVDQGEKFLDLVLSVAKISDSREVSSIQDPHRSSSEAPAVIASKLEAGLRVLG